MALDIIGPFMFFQQVVDSPWVSVSEAFVGSAAGAIFGAYAATKIAQRAERTKARMEALQRINALGRLAAILCADTLAYRRNILAKACEGYRDDRLKYMNYKLGKASGGLTTGWMGQPLPPFQLPFPTLHDRCLGETLLPPSTLDLAASVMKTVFVLEHSLAAHDRLRRRYVESRDSSSEDQRNDYYFARSAAVPLDESIGDLLDYMMSLSGIIVQKLERVALDCSSVAAALDVKLGRTSTGYTKIDFSDLRKAGDMPVTLEPEDLNLDGLLRRV